MKLKLWRAVSILVVLFTLSLTAYTCENNPDSRTTLDPAGTAPAVIAMADRILAEQAETSASAGRNIRIASNSPDSLLSTADEGSVSKWLEDRAMHADRVAEAKARGRLVAKHTHSQEDIEIDMGGGWCDLCGCWMHHGLDPNGTPQSEIGHPYVCQGGASTQNCWSHYYKYCFSS